MTTKETENKPTIETLINTAAIILTTTGTGWVVGGLTHKGMGFVLIVFGAGLEFFKYWGRKKKYW